jgi:hypothetical protein
MQNGRGWGKPAKMNRMITGSDPFDGSALDKASVYKNEAATISCDAASRQTPLAQTLGTAYRLNPHSPDETAILNTLSAVFG